MEEDALEMPDEGVQPVGKEMQSDKQEAEWAEELSDEYRVVSGNYIEYDYGDDDTDMEEAIQSELELDQEATETSARAVDVSEQSTSVDMLETGTTDAGTEDETVASAGETGEKRVKEKGSMGTPKEKVGVVVEQEEMTVVDEEEAKKAATQADLPGTSRLTGAGVKKLKKKNKGTSCCPRTMGMKLRCLEGSASSSTYSLLENINLVGDKDSSTEKQEELQFFNDSGSFTSVVVEKNLRSIDLCLLLAVKNRVLKDYCWSIVEHWVEIGLERVLEDHEDVLSVHRQTEHGAKKYIFRRYQHKYDFFTSPKDFFPADMVDLKEVSDDPLTTESALFNSTECPLIFSQVCMQNQHNKNLWVRTFLLLKNKKLLMSSNVHVVAKFLRNWKSRKSCYTQLDEPDANRESDDDHSGLHLLADLKEYEIYSCLNSKNQLKAPTEFGVCLRRTSEDDFAAPIVFSCENSKDRTCWLTAMRLAKYGKQLKENYREFKNKQRAISFDDMSRMGGNENFISRVAMDFTGSVGRIVDDPTEAKAIAVADASGSGGKHRLRSSTTAAAASAAAAAAAAANAAASSCSNCSNEFDNIDRKHWNKPWYHKDMTREQAQKALLTYAHQDGTFVLRDSRSQPGCHVLSFKCQNRVLHMRIYPLIDPVNWEACYSLDNGQTKFYTLVKLVEFYRLNQGSLPIRLACYLEKVPPRWTDN